MNRQNIRDQVIRCLRTLTAEESHEPIEETTNPMLKLGLDSHDGVNLACILSEEFACEIPDEVNPLVDDKRNRPRTVGEITDLVCKLLIVDKEQSHA